MNTPWGYADHKRVVADGIVLVSTPSHGGYRLTGAKLQQFKRRWPDFVPFAGDGWFEEDCDWVMVVVTFPEYFTAEHVQAAHDMIHLMAKRAEGGFFRQYPAVAARLRNSKGLSRLTSCSIAATERCEPTDTNS